MSDISVLGIFVADISFSGSKIPAIGETILGTKYNIGPGGKGCNQAIAIARLGGKVSFISKIGKDNYGELALETLKAGAPAAPLSKIETLSKRLVE